MYSGVEVLQLARKHREAPAPINCDVQATLPDLPILWKSFDLSVRARTHTV